MRWFNLYNINITIMRWFKSNNKKNNVEKYGLVMSTGHSNLHST